MFTLGCLATGSRIFCSQLKSEASTLFYINSILYHTIEIKNSTICLNMVLKQSWFDSLSELHPNTTTMLHGVFRCFVWTHLPETLSPSYLIIRWNARGGLSQHVFQPHHWLGNGKVHAVAEVWTQQLHVNAQLTRSYFLGCHLNQNICLKIEDIWTQIL